MPGILDALKIIKEQFPKFTQEMGVPFLGKDKPSSVMDSVDPNAEKRVLETLLTAAATIPGVAKLGKVALANPFKTGAATAAVTGDPTNLIGNPILALAASPGDAEASIMRGGKVGLNMTHETEIYGLMQLLSGRASLSSPSIAISQNNARPFSGGRGSASLIMNPTSHLFDPAEAQANQLLNRDMYAMRSRVVMKPPSAEEMKQNAHLGFGDSDYLREILTKAVSTRSIPLEARIGTKDVRLTEGIYPGEDQALSILASPNYRSFSEYEKRGAPLLSNYRELPKGSHDYRDTREAIDEFYHSDPLGKSFYDEMVFASTVSDKSHREAFEKAGRSFLNRLQDESNKGNFLAHRALKNILLNPSEYAELKVASEVPINSRNVSAILLPNSTNLHPDLLKYVVRNADALGIPADTAKGLLHETGTAGYNQSELRLEKILENVEREARHAAGSPDSWEKLNAGLTQETKRYLDPYSLGHLLTAKEEGVGLTEFADQVRKVYENSEAFAADVIGMITHQATLK